MVLEVLIFMLSIDCSSGFDQNFWGDFDGAMLNEWNITTVTSCHEVDQFPTSLAEYKSLANRLASEQTGTSSVDFTGYIDNLLAGAEGRQGKQVVFLTQFSLPVFRNYAAGGISYVKQDMAFVKNNMDYSTGNLSHEVLHLALEEEGYDKACYADKVHENQHLFVMEKMGSSGNSYPILKKFDC